MKRAILIIGVILMGLTLRAQSVTYSCRYWFDQSTQMATTEFTGSLWEEELDVGTLTNGLHTLHLQVMDATTDWSATESFLFLKLDAPSGLECQYWFDQDLEGKQVTAFSSTLLLDVDALDLGMHTLHILLKGTEYTSTESYLFLKADTPEQIESYTCHYWFDQDFDNLQSVDFGDGNLLLDVNDLTDGIHTLHLTMEGTTLTSTESYMFVKVPVEEVDTNTYRYWFDRDLDNSDTFVLTESVMLLDVSGLDNGLHSLHLMKEGSSNSSTESYLFVKIPVEDPVVGMQYQCWFDSDISSLQTGPVGSGIFFIDVISLPIGEHEMVMQLNNGVLSSPEHYTFYRDPAVLVSANPVEAGSATVELSDSIYTISATANWGYTFVNWTQNGEEVTTENTFSITTEEDVAYEANFEINSYDIVATVAPNNSGTVEGAGTYVFNTACTLIATANVGYTFANWTENGQVVSTDATYTFTVTDDRTLVAHFTRNIYQIAATANPEAGGTITGAGAYYYGETATLIAAASVGYTFSNWTENGQVVSTNATYAFTATDNRVLVANFTLNRYRVVASANPVEGGTVTGAGYYYYGETATLTATATEGYTFTNWTENGQVVSTNATYAYTMTGNRTLVANFTRIEYEVVATANPEAGGTITGAGTYYHGETATLRARVNTGYTFVNWTENGQVVSTSATYTITVTSNRNLVANFNPKRFRVLATANPVEGGSVTGAGYYYYGDLATLTATASEGYTFVNWTRNGVQISTQPVISFTVTKNQNFVANFETSNVTQTVVLAKGWNWYSTYIEQEDIDGLGQLENSIAAPDVVIQSQNSGQVKSVLRNGTVLWGGNLTSVNNEEMYKIGTKRVRPATMVGQVADPESHPITINKGWNWIGFPVDHSVSVSEALSGFRPKNNDVIKGLNSVATFSNGTWSGTLNTLEPGQGYMYGSKSNAPKTLVYQSGRGEATLANITPENNYYQPVDDFGDNMTVIAVIELDGEELRSEDYELAAFVGDECRGSVKLMYVEPINRYVAFLTVFGDETEDLSFVLTDGMDMSQSEDFVRYETDGTTGTITEPVTLRFGTLGMGDGMRLPIQIYPNPSKGIFNIECVGIRKVEVTNAYGQVILSEEVENDNLQIDLSDKAAGAYLLRVVTDKGVTTKKLVKE